MASIRSRGNRTTEGRLRMALVSHGVRGWTVLPDGVLGRPDFVFSRARLALFVDGCFWHGCRRCYIPPRSNKPYWKAKLERNRKRDRRTRARLRREGWMVVSLWEHELRTPSRAVIKVLRVLQRRRGSRTGADAAR
jgi:DNA mismatch endonuclease, patch repair protein